MDGEVPALDAVVEAAVDGEMLAVGKKRLEEGGLLPGFPGCLGEEAFLLEAEEVPHGDKPASPGAGSFRGLHGGVPSDRFRHERGQSGKGEGGTHGTKQETTAIERSRHGGRWIREGVL